MPEPTRLGLPVSEVRSILADVIARRAAEADARTRHNTLGSPALVQWPERSAEVGWSVDENPASPGDGTWRDILRRAQPSSGIITSASAAWDDAGRTARALLEAVGLQDGEALSAGLADIDGTRRYAVHRGRELVCEVVVTERDLVRDGEVPFEAMARRIRHALERAREQAANTP